MRKAKENAKVRIESITSKELDNEVSPVLATEEGHGIEEKDFSDEAETSRPTKKAKVISGSSSKKAQAAPTTVAKKPSRRRKSLDLLPTMPLDILYEVLGQLHPRDLVSLSKTNKLFRDTLVSDSMRVVWKRARESRGAPDCPSDMKEHQWVELLFVPECQVCGKKNTQKVDFLIRRRLCTACRKSLLVLLSKVRGQVPKPVLDHLPFTTSAVASFAMIGDPAKRSARRYFFRPDIIPMVTKMAEYQHLETHSAEGKTKFEKYKENKRQLIRDMHLSIKTNQSWLVEAFYNRHQDDRLIQEKRRETINAKLVNLGYSEDDISLLKYHVELERKVALTDRMWQRIQPLLETEIRDIRRRQSEKRYAELQATRRDVVEKLYDTYKLSLPPSEWRHLPRVFDICKFAPFSLLIDAPPETTVTAKDFEPAMEQLPDLLNEYNITRLETFRWELVLSVPQIEPDVADHSALGETTTPPTTNYEVDSLDLAISVFQCCGTRGGPHRDYSAMIGVDDLLSHHCELPRAGLTNPKVSTNGYYHGPYYAYNEYYLKKKTFSADGSRISGMLVGMAGLDAETALAEEMDRKDLRFFCNHCRARIHNCGNAFAFSWRMAITHGLRDMHGFYASNMPPNSWSIVPETQAAEIKAGALADCEWEQSIWTCRHCTTIGENFQTRTLISNHVKTVHDITDPKQFEDFFVLDRSSRLYYTNVGGTFP